MPRAFLIRTQTRDDDAIVEAIAGRENELASYDANVTAYEMQLAAMAGSVPAEWPESLLKYKGKTAEQVFANGGTDAEKAMAVSLNHRDRIKMLLFTEKAERAKSELAYEHIKSQLTTDQTRRQAAISRFLAKIAAQGQ